MLSTTFKRFFTTCNVVHNNINHVTIIGAGLMGSGIGQVVAQSGRKATIVDQSSSILEKSKQRMMTSLQRVGKKKFKDDSSAITQHVSETMKNIVFTTDEITAAKEADLLIEAVIENTEIKRELFSYLDKVAKPSTIFASNTSGILIREVAEVTDRRDRFLGLHFFNPVPVMKLLEIIHTPELSGDVLSSMEDFGKSLGKVCVKCKDTPGFIVNRILLPFMMDAIKMAERGDASMRDIDFGMKMICGHPIGPIELVDFTGTEILENAMKIWEEQIPGPRIQQSELLSQLVRDGHYGMKTGKGLYDYKN